MNPPLESDDRTVAVPDRAVVRCLVCGGPLLPHRRLPALHGCPRCHFVTLAADVDDDQLKDLYGADYFHGDEYADYVSEEPELRRNFRERLATILRLQPVHERHRLYEVGAAYGFFLDEARSHYQDVAGIDISEDAAKYAQAELGLDVAADDYLAVQVDPVDIICMWDTVEHLGRPREFLAKAAQDLRPGGRLALTTGDIGSLNARLRGRRWRMIHPPTHLHYFSRETLGSLLDDVGFDVIHVETAGNSRSLRAIAYALLVLKARQHRLYSRFEQLSFLDKGLTLDLRDIMFVVAQRRS
jgi:SAM-dependent methyltransferase